MGVYIQTPNGLKKITGLDYTPAKQEDLDSHINDNDVHVTSDDKSKWNNKADSDHNHDYNDLENKPNVETDTDDNALIITDAVGNIIARIDANGVNSVDLLIDGESVLSLIKESQVNVDLSGYYTKEEVDDKFENIPTTDLSNYYTKDQTNSAINNATKDKSDAGHNHDELYAPKEHNHDTYATKEELNNKFDSIPSTDLSGYYTKDEVDDKVDEKADKDHNHDFNDLENKPNIDSSDEDDSLTVTDSNGNIIATINKNGVDSVDLLINGVSVKDLIGSGGSVDLSNYFTKDETNSAINNAVKDKSDTGHNHDDFYALKDHTHNYTTEARVNELIAAYMTENYENGDEGSY